MEAVVNTSYNMELVVLSYAISMIGAFMALVSARRLLPENYDPQTYKLALFSSGIALGGIGGQ